MTLPDSFFGESRRLIAAMAVIRRQAQMRHERWLRYEIHPDDWQLLEATMEDVGTKVEPGLMPRFWGIPAIPADDATPGHPRLVLDDLRGSIEAN